MSSGTYTALSGALVRERLMDTISHNLANNQTVGFKKGQAVFKTVLEQASNGRTIERLNLAEIEEGFTDFSQGTLMPTQIATHLGIDGPGFFKVQDEAGNLYYTRQGNMRLDDQGRMINSQGMLLLGEDQRPIVLPDPEVTISQNGTVLLADGQTRRIPLYTFEDMSVLQRNGGNLFQVENGREDQLEVRVADPEILQAHLENANINLMEEMSRMVEATRVFEACQKMLKTYHALAEKANQLGTLS